MRRRKVRFTSTARNQLRVLEKWWRTNSDRPGILHEDLEEAVELLAVFPGIGSPYARAPLEGVRRLYLERLMCHLYYTHDERQLVIRALWHTRRGAGPSFGSSG